MALLLNGCFEIVVHEAKKLPKTDNLGFTEGDPLLELRDHMNRILFRTKEIRKTRNPVWEERGVVSLIDCSELRILIKDKDPTSEDLMTKTTLKTSGKTLAPVLQGMPVSGWIPLEHRNSELRITICPQVHRTPGSLGLQHARFPSNPGCRVTLFQSAHIGSERNYLPQLTMYNGCEGRGFGRKHMHPNPTSPWQQDDNGMGTRPYNPRNCWEEIYVSLLEAKYMIYIVGWSVNVEIPLLRERNIVVPGYEDVDGTKLPLGDLLIKKAREGLTVNIMLWREATSVGGGWSDGVAGTFSENTKSFFRQRETAVNIKTLLRESDTVFSLNKVCYSHHQKYVVVDAPSLEGSSRPRRLVAFLGGLDLTKGRFDTPRKHLWGKTSEWFVQDTFNDFYQACVDGANPDDAPRQPWQDIHCKLEGPVVRDLVTNFEERWLKQTTEKWHESLFRVDKCTDILPRMEDYVTDPDHHENWNVQLLRSIDACSVINTIGVEGGIHFAYEQAIMRAERFLYFENQYFMGGSKAWKSGKRETMMKALGSWITGEEVQAVNRIPLLIVARITRAINEGKRFAVYINIPMFPEGLPEAAPMQEIIFWQFNTMEMMYSMVAEALRQAGSSAHPTQYLNFFCLANREPGPPQNVGNSGVRKDLVGHTRRHMIYVHSKLLIADDDYVILGSANINDRSMAGDRDTEICIGAYQPYHSRDKGVQYANGGVQSFRLSLWSEHLNQGSTPNSVLYYPESLECVEYVQQRTEQAWAEHAGDAVVEQVCHMVKWPINVSADGSISPKQEFFPDSPGGKVRGRDSSTVPDFMTS